MALYTMVRVVTDHVPSVRSIVVAVISGPSASTQARPSLWSRADTPTLRPCGVGDPGGELACAHESSGPATPAQVRLDQRRDAQVAGAPPFTIGDHLERRSVRCDPAVPQHYDPVRVGERQVSVVRDEVHALQSRDTPHL